MALTCLVIVATLPVTASAFSRQESPRQAIGREASEARTAVIRMPVTFRVTNVNRSDLPCPSDGRSYTVAGRVIAPRSVLAARSRSATLYLHEFGWGRFFWKFPSPELNYARQQAKDGHASIVIDRIGYDRSSHPPGTGTCLGSQADVANQVVNQLKSGGYEARNGRPVRFRRVAVGGHSAGGAIAELATYSFADIDALLLFAYADQGFTTRSIQEANEQGLVCATGGEPAEPGEPGGYAYFAQTAREWRTFMFNSAKRSVAMAASDRRNRDPCGDAGSLTPAVVADNAQAGEIDVPVLLLYGTSDAIYEQPQAGEQQRDLFTGSDDVTLRFFKRTGHALTVEQSAPVVRGVVSRWLRKRGF